MLGLHKASFVVWVSAFAIHVQVHAARLVAFALVLGLTLPIAVLPARASVVPRQRLVATYDRGSPVDVDVNGTRLWFDVDGPGLVPEGSEMRQRPTLVLVHGGPGVWDHSYFKPDFAALAEDVQLVYLDLRGHGRSDWDDPAAWSFETCADDVRVFCDRVGFARPIVLGHSMGGPIVLLYGARHPGHAAGLIVQSGFARFDLPRLVEGFRHAAGADVAEIAGRGFRGEQVTDEESARVAAAFGPHVPDEEQRARALKNLDLNAPGMDLVRRVDIVDELSRIDVPTLVSVGELDPVTPVGAAEEIVAALSEGVGRLEVIDGAGHWAWKDAPDRYWPMILDFIHTVGRERIET